KQPFGEPDTAIGPVALSPDGKTLATCAPLGAVRLWSFPEGQRRLTLGRGARPTSMAFAPQGGLLVVGTLLGYLRFYDPATGQEKRTILAHATDNPRSILAVVFSPDGKLLASGGTEGIVRVWEVESGQEVHAWKDRK